MRAATDERSANAALARAVETARRHRRTNAMLLGLALGVLLGLVYAPRSRWIVAEQARRAVSARASGFPATSTDLLSVPEPAFDLRLDRAFLDAAATRPDDAEVQTALTAFRISSAFGSASVDDVVDAFLPLLDRFPSTPESHAAALRLAAMRMARREPAMPRERWLWSLDHVIAIAKRGETLDPENGYFSAMRAAALYTAGRNGEALAALSDAASRPEWRDGIEFQVHGAWRLSDSAFGAANPVARAKMASTVDLSGYPLLRQAAGRAAAQALSAERAGRLADGYAIRHDLLVIGGRMRAGSSTLLGSLAGSAIQRL
jgi:hypothetical protein